MKKALLIVMALLLTVAGFATTIRDIQYTADVSGDSPLKNQVVTVSGIVTGEPYAFGGSTMYIQDAPGAWNGIFIYLGANVKTFVADSVIISEGDSVTITGTVDEYNGLTQIKSVTSLVFEEAGVGCFSPTVAPLDSLKQEKYEGCLIRAEDVAISNPDAGFGEWEIADATDSLLIDDDGNAPYYFWPEEYDSLISITGLLNYSYSNYKIVPRLAWDIVEGPLSGETKVYTRIQRIQQVRGSDLMKTPLDAASDFSYLVKEDTTLYVQGVVTMPTGLSYAGDGVKFILSDLHGGPWSAILSYNEDASIYPNLFAGFEIEMSGYIGEYSTFPSNMTEFWLVGDVTITNPMGTLPDTAVITTGDLRLPITAEQWGNNIVRIEDALIIDNSITYYMFEIDDGTGGCLVAADSDSLDGYISPPIMTPIESITGWIYHHYGSYADFTTYGLCPLYEEDIVLGEGPAMLLYPSRLPSNIPTSSQNVVASVLVSTLRNVDTAKVFYRINNGVFANVDMIDAGESIWSGTIPAQANNSIVEYYYYIVDDSSDVSTLPSNFDEKLFTYKVLDGDETIYDIQYTHASSGDSPLGGCTVSFDAYMTCDGSIATTFTDEDGNGIISVASEPGPWNGVWVLVNPASVATLHEGDIVTISGVVDEDHEADWKWQENTYVVGTATLVLNEVPLAATAVTLANLEGNPEAYEGVLIDLTDGAEVESINSYDLTLTDGTYSFLLDDDIVADSILDINYRENAIVGGTDTLIAGGVFTNIKGLVLHSYGSIKIEVRKLADLTVEIVEPGVTSVPSDFILHQNYPNPFNPVTTIQFDLPNASDVKLMIYDINGRLVEELVNGSLNAGRYNLRWNASHLSSGVYFYRIQTPEYTATNKMLLLK